ncbi:MAG: DUF362 domain-containing protein [Candidatus Shapirobacteria bacterium]|nr:DUF362 domain-containing protein [Candidatus Shapirobacteria bacterium]
MDRVYFLQDEERLKKICLSIFGDFYSKNSVVLIKIHFGEPGNQTALFPKDVDPVIKALKDLGIKPTFIDTPVVYPSPRNNVQGYSKVVKDRGYDRLAPFIISDQSIDVKTKDFTAKVCKELIEAKNVLVISHVKGHPCAGFGGAIKNFGMGGVMKETKSLEHTFSKPRLTGQCQSCDLCTQLCPFQAIKMVNQKPQIDLNTCAGCSICEINCPKQCLTPKKALFDDLLAQGASAVIKNLSKKTYYLNIIKNITKMCDCFSNAGEIVAEDIGFLFSDNPVAIDQASLDLINQKNNNKNLFKEIHHKDPYLQIKFASKYLGKKTDYQLQKI